MTGPPVRRPLAFELFCLNRALPKDLASEWDDKKAEIYLPALFEGGHPFEGRPATVKPQGLPPTRKDELGADHEAEDAMPTDDW